MGLRCARTASGGRLSSFYPIRISASPIWRGFGRASASSSARSPNSSKSMPNTTSILSRQAADVESYRRDESLVLPTISIMRRLPGLSNEARHKLQAHRPRTIGQAGRIDGMTPAALTLLVAHVRRQQRKPGRGAA